VVELCDCDRRCLGGELVAVQADDMSGSAPREAA